MRFLDRVAELAFLERHHRAREAQLVVIWGRRRVGKTALLARFAERHGILYHLATRSTPTLELARFSRRAAEHFRDDVVANKPEAVGRTHRGGFRCLSRHAHNFHWRW